MTDEERAAFMLFLEVRRKAEHLLGPRAWFLLSCYGKLREEGPYPGCYVSGASAQLQLDLIRRLYSGHTVPVHLMHRHKSGDSELSTLRWSPERGLVMVFENREERA